MSGKKRHERHWGVYGQNTNKAELAGLEKTYNTAPRATEKNLLSPLVVNKHSGQHYQKSKRVFNSEGRSPNDRIFTREANLSRQKIKKKMEKSLGKGKDT